MYNPVLGRFLSEDPIGYESGDVNLYRYVQDNPPNATDPTGLDEKEARERALLQFQFGVPTDKDAPLAVKIYSPKSAPIGLSFADETFWAVIRDQMSGKPGIGVDSDAGKNIARENAAAKAMMEWQSLKGLDLQIYYVGNSDKGPEEFLKDAAKKGYGSVNVFFGHGNGGVNFDLTAALKNLENPGNAAPPLFGIGSCFAARYNREIPKENQIPNAPDNKDELSGVQTPRFWTPMIEAADKIIRERLGAGAKLQVNLYFGEMSMNSYDVDLGLRFKNWAPHPNRYQDWKWKK